jgi:hypothetical protein
LGAHRHKGFEKEKKAMYAKKIKYLDFNDVEREETFYFNLTETELVEMETSMEGGLSEYGKRIIESQNIPEVMALFKKLILITYGEKSADGKRFIKEDPVRGKLALEFQQTNAYSELYMEFINNPDSAAEFFNNVIPTKMRGDAASGQAFPPSVQKA